MEPKKVLVLLVVLIVAELVQVVDPGAQDDSTPP